MNISKILRTLFGYPVARREPVRDDFLTQYKKRYGGALFNPESTDLSDQQSVLVVSGSKLLPKWWCMSGIEPSAAEKLIIEALQCYPHVRWHREVCFEGFVTPKGGNYRFDFYLPALNTIIEYNGAKYHQELDRLVVDDLKRSFCEDHGINLVVFDKKHYYQLGTHIDHLLYSNNVSLI